MRASFIFTHQPSRRFHFMDYILASMDDDCAKVTQLPDLLPQQTFVVACCNTLSIHMPTGHLTASFVHVSPESPSVHHACNIMLPTTMLSAGGWPWPQRLAGCHRVCVVGWRDWYAACSFACICCLSCLLQSRAASGYRGSRYDA